MVTIVVTPHWRWVLLITRTNQRCSMQSFKDKKNGGPMTNNEFQALEDAILDIMAQDQKYVNNEDLRYMMNETIWYAAKETVKNKASEKPTADEEHVVDLRKAINGLMEPSVSHTIELRKAIQQ